MRGEVVTGHEWSDLGQIRPAVHMAISVSGPHHPSCRDLQSWDWILDYEWNTYGCIRVHGAGEPWLPRMPLTAHLYPPGCRFSEDTRAETGDRSSMWVHIRGGEAAGLNRLIDPVRGYVRFLDDQRVLGAAIRRAVVAGARFGASGFWQAQSAMAEAIDLLHRSTVSNDGLRRIAAPRHDPSDAGLADRVVAILKRDLAKKVTIDRVAAELGLSPSTVAHRYRAEAGEPPLATLTRLRMAHAKRLIVRGYPLKLVAEQTGHADPYHFSKAFRRHIGVAPSEYRRFGPSSEPGPNEQP